MTRQRAEELLARAVEMAPEVAQITDALEELARRQVARGDFAEAEAAIEGSPS